MGEATTPLGRRSVVRLVPYGRPAAGVATIQCAGRSCVRDTARYRDPVEARVKALAHVRQHASLLGKPSGLVRCVCQHDGCIWHRGRRVSCGGPTALVLIPDQVGRVWVLAEVCSRCAQAVPCGKIIQTADIPPPAPPSSPAPVPAATVTPGDQGRVTPRAANQAARDRALNCPLCAAEQTATPVPDAPSAKKKTEDGYSSQWSIPERWTVPEEFGQLAAEALDRIHQALPAISPEAALLALLLGLRSRPGGALRMVIGDLQPGRMNLPSWALEELLDYGWLEASLDEIHSSAWPNPPAQCRIPRFPQGARDLTGARGSAMPRVNGWVQRMVGHPQLNELPAADRLAALFAATRAAPGGAAQIGVKRMAAVCRYRSPELGMEGLTSLKTAGWFTQSTRSSPAWCAPSSPSPCATWSPAAQRRRRVPDRARPRSRCAAGNSRSRHGSTPTSPATATVPGAACCSPRTSMRTPARPGPPTGSTEPCVGCPNRAGCTPRPPAGTARARA